MSSTGTMRRSNENRLSVCGLQKSYTKPPINITVNDGQGEGSGLSLAQSTPISSTAVAPTIPHNGASEVGNAKIVGHGMVSKLKVAMKVILNGCGLCPLLVQAAKKLLDILDCIEVVAQNNQKVYQERSDLLQRAVVLSEYLSRPQSLPKLMTERIVNLTEELRRQAEDIEKSLPRTKLRRLIETEKHLEGLQKCFRIIETSFSQLQLDASLSAWTSAEENLKSIVSQNSRLEGLAPSHLARYDSTYSDKIQRRACCANTRAAILGGLRNWANVPEEATLMMLGMAGTGKTSISYSFCEELERNKQLGASFFCFRTSSECEDVTRIIPTIAYQLAHGFCPFKSVLCRILGETPNLAQRNIETQFEYLIKMPLLEIEDILPKYLVVVIDGLDECPDSTTTSRLLDILLQCSQFLPVKFFLTSRPQPTMTIMHPNLTNDKPCRTLYLQLDKQVEEDIQTVLSVMLSRFQLSEDDLKRLVGQCGGLFVYAVTLARHLLPSPREPGANISRRLEAVLGRGATRGPLRYKEMDRLYKDIIGRVLIVDDDMSEDRVAEIQEMQQVFRTVLCAREALSNPTLTVLSRCSQAWSIIQWFRSVLHISKDGTHEATVSVSHASLPEFMFSAKRAGPLTCDEQAQNALFAKRCFNLMEGLEFNHGQFTTLDLFDNDVPQLQTTLQETVSPLEPAVAGLSYACRYWAEHLKKSGPCEELLESLREFLCKRLLFWVEVMNLKGWISCGPSALIDAQTWTTHAYGEGVDEARKFLHDAHNFLTRFAANPVCRSTPHVYTSLTFEPRDSEVWRHYSTRVNGPVGVDGSIIRQRGGAALATTVIGVHVSALACSLGGRLIAAGTADGKIYLLHTYDGAQFLQPFKAHSYEITSLAFFPGGGLIISGSQDGTIGVWNFSTHAQLPELQVRLQEHKSPVNSVAVAPNGTCFASASDDKTIRLWDPRTRDNTAPTLSLKGHASAVTSIQISPDSEKLVSGSQDLTVRVWDLSTAKLTHTFLGHKARVTSVIFSADGKYVISGSLDCTIRVWNLRGGVLLLGPFEGHSGGINSLALSPDGKRFISGGGDKRLSIWDTGHGRRISGPFEGHASDVTSLTFSPDNAHIISGSLDGTVKLWDARPSTVFARLSQGHVNGITCIATSGDGTLIATGSQDSTIYIWASENGVLYSGPFIGHKSPVTSIAFSSKDDCLILISGSRDHTIRIWSVMTGTLLDLVECTSEVNSVSISPVDTLVASAFVDATIRIWNFETGDQLGEPLTGHENSVTSVKFSSDGRWLASGSWDRTVQVWDVLSGTRIAGPFGGHTDGVTSVVFSLDCSLIVSGSGDGRIRAWRWNDDTTLASLFEGHSDGITSLALSTDGTCLVSGTSYRQIHVWSMPSGRLLTTFMDHEDEVTSVAFIPNEMRVVSGSRDQTVRVWQIPEGNEQPRWEINDSGWVVEHSSRPSLRLYVPTDLRDIFPRPPNILTIHPHGSISLSLREGNLDNLWQGSKVSDQV